MKYPKLIAGTLSLLVILMGVSCKKGSMLNLGTIKIATVNYSASGGIRLHYYIGYDAYDNVDSISIIGGGIDTQSVDYKTFTYVGSSFVINDYLNGPLTVYANTNGQILQVLTLDTATMTYNGSELTQLAYAQPSEIYTYQWNNGDITTCTNSGGVVDTYYYDLSRNGQAGDALRIDNFLKYGRSYITTCHLPDEQEYGGNWIEEDLYQFDSQKRISVLTRVFNGGSTSNDTETYAYTYY